MVCGENIVLHIGQAGCNAGLAAWELLCMEHGLYPDGTLATEIGHSRKDQETRPFFLETYPCKYVPRALFFDFDPDPIHDIKTSCYERLFSTNYLVAGKEDACNNFARGYYSMGVEFIECIMDKIHTMCEATDHLDSFTLFRSNGGGTGSGFGSLLITKIHEDYGNKVCTFAMEVSPSARFSTSPLETYNAVLGLHSSIDHINCNFMVENEKLYEICERSLDMRCSSYKNLNQLIAQVFSGITAGFRFDGSLNTEASELQRNLVPYPRIHYPLVTYAPLIPFDKVYHDSHSVNTLTNLAFEGANQMLHCNPRKGKYVAACLLFRGDASINDAQEALVKMKTTTSKANRFQFVDWCPTGVKLGLNFSPPLAVPGSSIACGCRSVVGIMNTTCIDEVWQRILKKHDQMYLRKAYVHWYLAEGVEEEEFFESRDNLQALMSDFRTIALDSTSPGQKGSSFTGKNKAGANLHR